VGDEAVGVKFAALPSHELLQIEVELRLKNPDRDGARPDPAADIGQKIVGIVEGEGDAVALEIRAQSTPIAGQGGGRRRWRRFRPVKLRKGGRAEVRGRAEHRQRGNSKRPRPTTSGDRAHIPRPRSDLEASFRCDSGKMLWPDGGLRHRRVTGGGYGSGCSSAAVIVRSNGASQ